MQDYLAFLTTGRYYLHCAPFQFGHLLRRRAMNLGQLIELDRQGVATIDVEQYAELMGVARGTGYEAVRRKDVQAVRVSGRWRVAIKPLLKQLGAPESR
jgi:hypothetical protein